MNKLLPVLFLLLSCVVSAEELKFITVLSSPVGSFNKLEAVDPTSAAQGTKVNFCTSLGNGGTVELKGAKDASLGNVNLDSAATLGRTSDGDYVLTNITLNSGGSVEGSRLLSNVVNINGSAVGKSDNLHSNSLTMAGAKTTGLNVNNKSIMSGTGSAEEMVWSNEYQSDTACGTDCSKQYLLKEFGGVQEEDNTVTCFTRIDWRTRMNNINEIKKDWDEWLKDVSDWNVDDWWFGVVTSPNHSDRFGETDAQGFTKRAFWYDGGGDCSRCEYAKPCKCTPGKEYRLNTVLAKVLHVPDKWHISQLEGWAVGICEQTTPDKCLSWKGSDLGLAIGGVAWTKESGPVAPKTPGGGTVTNYEVETIQGETMLVVPPDASYFAYCDYTD